MLTDAHCRNAACPAGKKREKLTDSGGLYLEISPAGSKRWFWKLYRDGKESRLSLGSYPAVSLTAARRARDAAKLQKAEGIDPVQARKISKLKHKVSGDCTLEATGREWLELHQAEWSETHYVREKRNLEKDLFPYLGERDIGKIEPIDLLAAIKRVEERGVSDVPHRVLLTARGVWQLAVATARAPRDITGDIKKALKPHIKQNHPAVIDPQELAELLRASIAYRGGPVMRVALRMAAILFQRPGNLRTMRWGDLDIKRALWNIPSEDMKRTKNYGTRGRRGLAQSWCWGAESCRRRPHHVERKVPRALLVVHAARPVVLADNVSCASKLSACGVPAKGSAWGTCALAWPRPARSASAAFVAWDEHRVVEVGAPTEPPLFGSICVQRSLGPGRSMSAAGRF